MPTVTTPFIVEATRKFLSARQETLQRGSCNKNRIKRIARNNCKKERRVSVHEPYELNSTASDRDSCRWIERRGDGGINVLDHAGLPTRMYRLSQVQNYACTVFEEIKDSVSSKGCMGLTKYKRFSTLARIVEPLIVSP